MFIKLLGAFLVISMSGLMGMSISRSFRDRPNEIREIRSALRMLETEIAYVSTPLPEALILVGRRIGSKTEAFFASVGESLMMAGAPPASEAWLQVLDSWLMTTALTESDAQILRTAGLGLGSSDRENEIKKLKLAQEHLRNAEASAERDRERNERMWRTIGFLGGLAVVIILY